MSESLSVEQAVGILALPEAPVEPEAAPEPEVREEEQPETEIEALPEAEDDDGAETPAAVEVEAEPETAVEPPHYWSADKKEAFKRLPVDLQQTLKEEWQSGERITSQRLEEAATAKKAAEAQAKGLSELTGRIAEAAEKAETTFASRWDGMTPEAWVKLSREAPDQYIQLKAQHDAEADALQRARTAREAAEQVQFAQWVNEQEQTLKTIAPDLADPVKGPERRAAVADYLRSQGVAEQALSNVGALEAAIAWKALQYDKGVSGLRAKPPQTRPAVKPSAPPAKPTSALESATRRLGQTGDVDDAVALLQLRRKNG